MLKPKITIDTCVILPAYCWKRNSYLFMQHLDDYEWCLSEYIMDECKRILKNPKLAFFQEISKCVYLYKRASFFSFPIPAFINPRFPPAYRRCLPALLPIILA